MFGFGRKKKKGRETTAPEVETPSPAEKAPEDHGALITVYDAYGRELKIDRATWVQDVLKPNLAQKWDDPDALYTLILSAAEDGFADEVIDAAAHLRAIDPIAERGYTLEAIVRMNAGEYARAQETLEEAMKKLGRTAVLLTNLAKVQDYQERHTLARETLWEALQDDPNFNNAVDWWATLHHEEGGQAAYLAALEQVAALPESRRAQMWLGRHALEEGRVDDALKMYEAVVQHDAVDGDTLMSISGDLGNAGQLDAMCALIAPRYDLQRHTARVGLNLLQAYLQLGDRETGRALLHKMYALQIPPLQEALDHYAQQFDGVDDATGEEIDPTKLEIKNVSFDRPLWHYGLKQPTWLLNEKDADASTVIFTSFAQRLDADATAQEQRENTAGQLTRAIPLYLAESVYEWTDHRVHMIVPIVVGGGPIVSGTPSDGASFARSMADHGDYVVTGTVQEVDDAFDVQLEVWRTKDAQRMAQMRETLRPTQMGASLQAVQEAVLNVVAQRRTQPWDAAVYSPLAEDATEAYARILAQRLILILAGHDYVPASSLWGERNILQGPLALSLQHPSADFLRVMMVAGLQQAKIYGSTVLSEFRGRAIQMLKDADHDGLISSKLAPLVSVIFEDDEAFHSGLAHTPASASEAYRAWVVALQNTP